MQYCVVGVVNIFLHQWNCCADNNCTWSQWSEWSNCSQRCAVSQRNRTRRCRLTPPCIGDAVETENCLRENYTGNVICQLYVNYALRDLRLLTLIICWINFSTNNQMSLCCRHTPCCYCGCSISSFFSLFYSNFTSKFAPASPPWNKRDRIETLTLCIELAQFTVDNFFLGNLA